jgi:hypothetical protein
MAEVLVEFDTSLQAPDGGVYRPRVCGRVADDGLWEGWLEFLPTTGERDAVRTGRETGQPNRADLVYWAEGLSQVYLEGALDRALSQPVPIPRAPPTTSAFAGPRPAEPAVLLPPEPRAVLNPFEVYAQGPGLLRRQLDSVSVSHLRAIALAYHMAPAASIGTAPRGELTEIIMRAVQAVQPDV